MCYLQFVQIKNYDSFHSIGGFIYSAFDVVGWFWVMLILLTNALKLWK